MFEREDTDQPAAESPRLPGPDRRAVSVTPLDLRQCRFRSAFRGFDRDEVTAFLVEAASDYEHAVRDNERLREDMARLESSIAQFRNLEASLKTALISAQKVADDMKATAEQEAARIVREAQARADLLTERAQSRLQEVHRQLESVSLKRRHAVTGIEATISALRNTLEFIHEQDTREHDDRPAGAAPAPAAATPGAADRVVKYQPRAEAASTRLA